MNFRGNVNNHSSGSRVPQNNNNNNNNNDNPANSFFGQASRIAGGITGAVTTVATQAAGVVGTAFGQTTNAAAATVRITQMTVAFGRLSVLAYEAGPLIQRSLANPQIRQIFSTIWAQGSEIIYRQENQERLQAAFQQAKAVFADAENRAALEAILASANEMIQDPSNREAAEQIRLQITELLERDNNGAFFAHYQQLAQRESNHENLQRLREHGTAILNGNLTLEHLQAVATSLYGLQRDENDRNIQGLLGAANNVATNPEYRPELQEVGLTAINAMQTENNRSETQTIQEQIESVKKKSRTHAQKELAEGQINLILNDQVNIQAVQQLQTDATNLVDAHPDLQRLLGIAVEAWPILTDLYSNPYLFEDLLTMGRTSLSAARLAFDEGSDHRITLDGLADTMAGLQNNTTATTSRTNQAVIQDALRGATHVAQQVAASGQLPGAIQTFTTAAGSALQQELGNSGFGQSNHSNPYLARLAGANGNGQSSTTRASRYNIAGLSNSSSTASSQQRNRQQVTLPGLNMNSTTSSAQRQTASNNNNFEAGTISVTTSTPSSNTTLPVRRAVASQSPNYNQQYNANNNNNNNNNNTNN